MAYKMNFEICEMIITGFLMRRSHTQTAFRRKSILLLLVCVPRNITIYTEIRGRAQDNFNITRNLFMLLSKARVKERIDMGAVCAAALRTQ